jgi:predicted nucleic acid-binding protein
VIVVDTSALYALLDADDASHAAAVVALLEDVLPALRVEMVDRDLHDSALSAFRSEGGGTSLVDRVTLAFAAREGIRDLLGFDADLEREGLLPLS